MVSIPSRVLISSNHENDVCVCENYCVSIPSRVLISSNTPLRTDGQDIIERVSIPSRVLISSNRKYFYISAHIIKMVSIPSRVLISSNDDHKIHDTEEYKRCQSLQGFSYLLTVKEFKSSKCDKDY